MAIFDFDHMNQSSPPRQNLAKLPLRGMAKFRSSYVCQNCGAITQRWQGKCESCGEWNTIIEEAAALGVGGAAARQGSAGRPLALDALAGASQPQPPILPGLPPRHPLPRAS